jgi:hypothetical protein
MDQPLACSYGKFMLWLATLFTGKGFIKSAQCRHSFWYTFSKYVVSPSGPIRSARPHVAVYDTAIYHCLTLMFVAEVVTLYFLAQISHVSRQLQ